MPIEFDIKLRPKDMYRFNMYQNYTGASGLSSFLLTALLWGMAIYTYGEVSTGRTVIYVVIGVLMLVYMPITLKVRAKQIIATSPVLSGTLHYYVDENGFTVTQGEASGELPWKQIYKMVSTKHLVLVYSNRVNAYVIPKKQLGEQYIPLAKLAATKLPKYRLKMKVTLEDV